MNVLIVDDEPKIRELVRSYFEREGYAVTLAETAKSAIEAAIRTRPDLVILDLRLPDAPGEEVAQRLRAMGDVPIIMLTAKASEDERIGGLRLGADDYVVKPFSPRELVARAETVLRRAGALASASRVISFDEGRLRIDLDKREVTVGDAPLDFTKTEFEILHALASRPGRVFSRAELFQRLRGEELGSSERTIDVHVKNLRRKLGDDSRHPRYVVTMIGVGYRLGVKPDA